MTKDNNAQIKDKTARLMKKLIRLTHREETHRMKAADLAVQMRKVQNEINDILDEGDTSDRY